MKYLKTFQFCNNCDEGVSCGEKGRDAETRMIFQVLRIHWRLSAILKTRKKVYEVVLFDMLKYVYSESLFNTLDIEIKYKHFLWTKQMLQKMHSFFFRELQLITVLLLIRESYMSWSTRFVNPKVCVGFSIFDSVLYFLRFKFLFNKKHGLFDFKRSYFPSKLR